MKFETFIKTLRKDVGNFEKYWKENQEKEPQYFPDNMGEGDWWEQFIMWNYKN